MNNPVCYIIHPTQEVPKWTSVYRLFLQPTLVKAGYRVEMGLKMGDKGSPIDRIIKPLLEAELVVADISGGHAPEVFYLLGVRHARASGTIILTQEESCLPHDFRPYHVVTYQPDIEYQEAFEAEFMQLIDQIKTDSNSPDNPVLTYSQYLQNDLALREEIRRLKEQMVARTRAEESFATSELSSGATEEPSRPRIAFKKVN